jgi:hypothetical protein
VPGSKSIDLLGEKPGGTLPGTASRSTEADQDEEMIVDITREKQLVGILRTRRLLFFFPSFLTRSFLPCLCFTSLARRSFGEVIPRISLTFCPTVSCLERCSWYNDSRLISGAFEDMQPELRFLSYSLLISVLSSLPPPRKLPEPRDLVYVDSKLDPLRLKFGKDEVLFLLKKDDDFNKYLIGNDVDKRLLDTPTCVEVRPSPLGGLGLFTTKDCLPGDLLISERPMVST